MQVYNAAVKCNYHSMG